MDQGKWAYCNTYLHVLLSHSPDNWVSVFDCVLHASRGEGEGRVRGPRGQTAVEESWFPRPGPAPLCPWFWFSLVSAFRNLALGGEKNKPLLAKATSESQTCSVAAADGVVAGSLPV